MKFFGERQSLGEMIAYTLGLRKKRTEWLEQVVEETNAANFHGLTRYEATLRIAQLLDGPANHSDDAEYSDLKEFLTQKPVKWD